MRLTLPYPPSANLYWRVWRGRAVKSTEARQYQVTARRLAASQLGSQRALKRFSGPVAVAIEVYRPAKRGDLDNALKVMLDALKGVAFDDDKQICRICANLHDDKANPRIEVEVTAQ